MNNWQALGTILAGVAALVTAGVGLYEKLHTVQKEIYKPLTAEELKVDSKKEFGIVQDPDGWVYLREKANVLSDAIAKLLNDSHVEIKGQEGNWYKVCTSSGREGYIFKDRLLLVDEKK